MRKIATVTVIGKDRTGVIAKITNFLFEKKANIEALEEQVTRGQFSMTLQASWKAKDFDLDTIKSGLDALGRALSMDIRIKVHEQNKLQRCAIFVTKEPHCFVGLMNAFRSGELKAKPAVVISNKRDLEKLVSDFGLPFVFLESQDRAIAENQALFEMEKYEVDFVILARFMRILSPNFVWRYKNKIINIHPSLLPSFPGAQAYRQAYERGVKVIGVTAHFVTMHLDEGPIIAQDCFKVTPKMSLKDIVSKGQALETKVLIKAVKLYLSKRLDVYWGIVKQV
jgi:formyltetrahydrofolate deformylase